MGNSETKKVWIITKVMPQGEGKKPLNVVLLDTLGEVREWKDEKEVKELANFLQENSDLGYIYVVKKIEWK